MFKILHARLQQYVNWELSDVQAGFKKGRGTWDQIANNHWIIEKAREFLKTISTSASLTMLKPLTVWIITKWGWFLKRCEYLTTLPASWETHMQVKKPQSELDMEQQTGSKLGKEYVKAVYCHPAYLTYMQSTSCKMPGWINHKLESRLSGETSATSYMVNTLMAESEGELKSLLMNVKEESEKAALKLNIHKTKIMASGPIISWQIEWGKVETVTDFMFLGSKITVDGDCSHRIKRCLLLGRKAMTKVDSVLKIRDITLLHLVKDASSQSYGFSSSYVQMWQVNHKEGWAPKDWYFWTAVLEKTLEGPLDSKEIKPVNF